MKRLLLWVLAPLLLLAAAIIINALRLEAPATATEPMVLPAVEAAAVERLAGAIRIPTISTEVGASADTAAFARLADYLQAQFPSVHAKLQREVIAGASLLYHWPGTDSGAAPVLLLAHLDVVPVEPGTENDWLHPPFSGAIADGHVWGRGTLDDKSSALGWMEAVEHLLAAGYIPQRSLYFAFGHDEEIGGQRGAQAMAALLAARGVRAEFLLDEGGAITQGVVAGLDRPVASIMVAEKGYVSFRLMATAQGGHSSMPPPQTAVGRLARAVARVQERPLPARLTPPVAAMLEGLAPEMPLANRVLIANRWLFEPLLLRALADAPVTNAMIRTTTAPTMLKAGIKDNVLPSEAQAVVNFRLLPGDRVADVEAHLREAIADDGIGIEILSGFTSEASTVSPIDTRAYRALHATVRDVFPEAVVVPGLVTGGTDARHYDAVAQTRYNFLPLLLQREDLARVHGSNERISVQGYLQLVQWYMRLLHNVDAMD